VEVHLKTEMKTKSSPGTALAAATRDVSVTEHRAAQTKEAWRLAKSHCKAAKKSLKQARRAARKATKLARKARRQLDRLQSQIAKAKPAAAARKTKVKA
jgi:hypothetical protein